MSSAIVRTGIDSRINSNSPSANYGGTKTDRVQAPGSATVYSYIFLKNPAPRGATVITATLRLYEVGVFGSSVAVTVHPITSKWSDSQINYNNRPTVGASGVTLTQTGTVDGQEWAFDVTALLQSVCNGSTYYGFRLSTTDTTERWFYSLNYSDHQPVLEVEWSDAPDIPVELSPSGGAAVSIAKPVLTFNFHDVSGSTAMGACQVQIDPGNSFTSPAFDSGTVTTSDPELDLSTTAYAGLANGATTFWRVRVQDAAGIWSGWSAAREFTRINRGTLTLDNPAVSPNNFVSDSTPELAWTLTGATQIGWQVIIADDSFPTSILYNTGRRSGTAATHTPPAGIIKSETTTYRLTLRIWDEPLRVSTPGDVIFTEIVRTFTYVDDPTPNPVTSLVSFQVASDQPHVALQWHRSTAPDYFSVWRDGVCIATNLDAASLFVSGTEYQFIDRTASPYVAHVWKVRCKVNGVLSPSPTTTLTYTVKDVWLCDYDTGHLVPVVTLASDQASYDMPEVAGVYVPIDGDRSIRIVQGQRGLEGTISGRVVNRAGVAADVWVRNLFWMKSRPGIAVRLTINGQNLNVILGNVVIAPLPGGLLDERQVSFAFWSQDGPAQ